MALLTLDVIVRPGECLDNVISELIEDDRIQAVVTQEHGPGGGFPEVEFTGSRGDLEMLARRYNCENMQDILDTITRIQD